MMTTTPSAPSPADDATRASTAPVRRCALTRAEAPKATLLRVVLDPDGRPVFDVMGRAPGRGVYVSPDAETVRAALAPKGLGRLFRGRAEPPSPERVEALVEDTRRRLEARIADHVRFARRAGVVVWGVAEVLGTAGALGLVLQARDASPRSASDLAALDARGVPRQVHGDKQTLGEILGKTEVAALGVRPSVFVERILWDGERLRRLTNGARRPDGRAEPTE